MTFGEALKKLNIEDFGERIFASNSHGELFHLCEYISLAKTIGEQDASWFRPWFLKVVAAAEQQWRRPESVFQHLFRLLEEKTDGNQAD